MDSDPIPPSSPPRMSIVDPPSSPFFEQQEHAFSLKSSSPPPVFSSDDSRESMDITNYESPRIYKHKRKGTWWTIHDSATSTPEPKRSKISRNFDSGVYMMSDATDASDDMLPVHKAPFPLSKACGEQTLPMSVAETTFNTQLRAGLEKNLEIYDFRALDLHDTDIVQVGNLSSVIKNLPDPGSHLPAEGQYRSMVPEIFLNLRENNLCRLTPSLFNVQTLTILILRGNQIRELPQQIRQLKSLHSLDISLNYLNCLPFDMVQLLRPHGSLERLTAMGNPLLKPMSFARFCNPDLWKEIHEGHEISPVISSLSTDAALDLYRRTASEQLPDLYDRLDSSSDPELIAWHIRYLESWTNVFGEHAHDQAGEKLVESVLYDHHPAFSLEAAFSDTPRYMARTLVSFFDQAGHILRGSATIPESNDEDYSIIVETERGMYGAPSSPWFMPPSSSKVASLLTTSLHNSLEKRHYGEYSIEDVRDMLSAPIPSDANAVFTRAIENDAGGYGDFRQCHVCARKYVVARAEWVEFWSVRYGLFYPFKVRVCSWGCVPEKMLKKPEKELAIRV